MRITDSALDLVGNPANPDVHRRTTAEEIWADTDGQADSYGERYLTSPLYAALTE